MKKLLTVLMATIIVSAMSFTTAFAGEIVPSGSTETSIHSNEPDAEHQIRMFGYVGPDTMLIDPDPDNPDVPPVAINSDINIGVPVKLIWAAFASDGGQITSPRYHIKNYSLNKDIKVSILKFEAINNDPAAATLLTNLELKLISPGDQMGNVDLISGGDYKIAAEKIFGNNLVKQAPSGSPGVWNFTIGGEYKGTMPSTASAALAPAYNITFKFATV